MKKELIPYIDNQYRTDPLNRTLFGNSFGGNGSKDIMKVI